MLFPTWHSGDGQESRRPAPRLPQPRGRNLTVARSGTSKAQARPSTLPAPSGLAPGRQTAPPGLNFAREEEATQRIAGCMDARRKKRLFVHLPASKAVSPFLFLASVAPAHLREGTETPPRPPRWPFRHEASAPPPRSSRERGGARAADGRSCTAERPRGRRRICAGRKPCPDSM